MSYQQHIVGYYFLAHPAYVLVDVDVASQR